MGHWLADRGFRYCRYSEVIAAEARARGFAPERESLQRVGEELHATLGQRELGRRLLASVDGSRRIVVDGLRWRADLAFLRERYGRRLVHVHLSAEDDLRRARYIARGPEMHDFARASIHPVEREAGQLGAYADAIIKNNSSRADLFAAVERTGLLGRREYRDLFVETRQSDSPSSGERQWGGYGLGALAPAEA